jgi:hypothetical protein
MSIADAPASRVLVDLLALAARPDISWPAESMGPAWSWARAAEEEGGVEGEVREREREPKHAQASLSPSAPRPFQTRR